jgi:hypothetical protein
MARTACNSSLETRTARVRLHVRRTPYFAKIAKGLRLGYYRGAVAGSWIARFYRGAGVYATEALGAADDTLDAVPFGHVLGDARLRDLKPKLEQFSVNAWCSPKGATSNASSSESRLCANARGSRAG